MATVTVHPSLAALWEAILPARVFAFTTHAHTSHAAIDYRKGDALMFGSEPTGLSAEVLAGPNITEQVRIPMLADRRSLNLANAASIAVYEAWRQHGFEGAAGFD
jgi:tRNA (cytidine/uridine-2'-O-)-methyltransferase